MSCSKIFNIPSIVYSLLFILLITGTPNAADTLKLNLGKSIELALKYNHDLKHARFDKDKADERVREAWGSSVLPKINGFVNYNRALKRGEIIIEAPEIGFSGSFPQGTENTLTVGANLEQPLFTGAVFLAVRIAETYAEIQDRFVDATASEVIVSVKKAYYAALLADEVFELAKLNLQLAEDNLRNTEAMYNAGIVPEYDFIRAKVQVQNLIPELQSAENNVVLSRNLLKLVTGLQISDEISIDDSLELRDISLSNTDEYEHTMYESNYSIQQLKLNLRLQDDVVSYEFTKHFPELYFTGNWQTQAQENDPRSFGDWRYKNSVYIGLNLKVPIFDGFQTTSRVQQAKIDLFKAQEEYDKTVKVLKNSLTEVILSIEETQKRLTSYEATIEEARLAYDIAVKRYANGVGTQLETIDAMVSLTRARVNYYNAVYEYYILHAQLDQLLSKNTYSYTTN
jgi:outer membrane protein